MRQAGVALVSALMALMFTADALNAQVIERKRTYGLRTEGRGHIQMRSMIAPVKRSAKSRRSRNTSVTVILTVASKKNVGKVCRKGPRISDALLRAWYKKPMTLDYLYDKDQRRKTNVTYRRTPAQRKEDKRLVKVVNRAIGTKDVTGIMVLKGAMSMGGGAVTKLPFSSVNGCDELQEEEKKKKKKK